VLDKACHHDQHTESPEYRVHETGAQKQKRAGEPSLPGALET
jgi:hypothetical protein